MKSNFDSALSSIRHHIRAADFVAIDFEMTGVTSAPWRDSFQFDRFDVLYLKVKDSAEKFAVVQFGVCLFRWDQLKQAFITHLSFGGHNFFIFPRQELPVDVPAHEFLCQTSVDFLAKYQFDFNACIHEENVLQQRMKKSSTSLSSAFSILCSQIALGSKSSHLALQSCINVEVEVDDMRLSNWNSGAKHEAGYDAFMAGCVFAQACSYLGIDFKRHSSSENLAHNEKLQEHINLVYLSRTNGDIINLSTGNRISEPLASSKHKKRYPKILSERIVLVWGFPSELKAREIRECISKVLGPTSVISVYHVDETAVFVQFSKAELVSELLGLKEGLERSNYPISILHPLAKLLEGGNTGAASYETYKEICSSSISKVLFADQAEVVGINWKTKLVESSNLEVETKEHESLRKINSTNFDSSPGVRTKNEKIDYVTNDSSCGQLSPDQVVESLYTAKGKQIMTIGLRSFIFYHIYFCWSYCSN